MSTETSPSPGARPGAAGPPRILALWCPDWPVVAAAAAAGTPAHRPAAVFAANRVVACSAAARSAGVGRGMRRRQAQSRCPELAVFPDDPGRDARLFESVAAAVEELVVGVDVVRPGLVAVPVSGASGYFGGEERLVELLLDHVSSHAGVECQIGIADGLFAATLAAHRSTLVAPGASPGFLAPRDVAELDAAEPGTAGSDGAGPGRSDLVGLLRRLGLRTLGDFAALPERDVTARFGSAGLSAHRLARGRDERPPHRRSPPPESTVTESFDPPLDRIDVAAFLARTQAERFHTGLADRGLACTRLGIHATTENGEELVRVWRCAEPLSPAGVADRVRWQFEGWLRAEEGTRPTAGIVELRLVPEEVVRGHALQLGLWPGGGSGAEHTPEADRAGRALVHVQGLLGPEGVGTPVVEGGRGPAERVRLVPWGERRTPADGHDAPWPGRLPAPSPATVYERPPSASVTGVDGDEVDLTDRNELTRPPHRVAVGGGIPRRVLGWAGPWVVQARWWAPDGAGTHARIQVVLDTGTGTGTDTRPDVRDGDAAEALLLRWSAEPDPHWTVEGSYD